MDLTICNLSLTILDFQTFDGTGETQVRRVCLPRITDEKGDVSYEELVGLVLVFTLNETGAGKNEYSVSLTYYDNEQDLITLASTEDLIEAINLFAGQKFLRITTRVKPRKSFAPAAAAAAHRGSSATDGKGSTNHSPALPIPNVLKSFAGILIDVADELKALATIPVTGPRTRNDNNNVAEAKPKGIKTKTSKLPHAAIRSTYAKAKKVEKSKIGKVTKSVSAAAAAVADSRSTTATGIVSGGTKERKKVTSKAVTTVSNANKEKVHHQVEDSSAKDESKEETTTASNANKEKVHPVVEDSSAKDESKEETTTASNAKREMAHPVVEDGSVKDESKEAHPVVEDGSAKDESKEEATTASNAKNEKTHPEIEDGSAKDESKEEATTASNSKNEKAHPEIEDSSAKDSSKEEATTASNAKKEKAHPEVENSSAKDAPKEEATTASNANKEKVHPKVEDRSAKDSSKEEAKPFIHGRHTCDTCFTTPIVGKRYHSTNLPDYDLCNSCFDNYSGTEINFETVELARDIPLQFRWHARYRRQVELMKAQDRAKKEVRPEVEDSSAKDGPKEEATTASNAKKEEVHHPEVEDSSEKDGSKEAEPFIHARHTCDGCGSVPIIGKRYRSTNIPNYDLCNRCFDNYSGNEIQFETVELARDTALQLRWQKHYRKKVALMKAQDHAKKEVHPEVEDSSAKDGSKEEATTASNANKEEVHPEVEDSSTKDGSKEEVEPFIHGRHTCDGCGTAPIVGKRYRSTNLPDYDLCNSCFDNYSGSKIEFYSVKLDRDIPLQSRWLKRHQRQLTAMKRQERFGRRGRGRNAPRGRRFGKPNHHGKSHCRPKNAMKIPEVPPREVPSPSKEKQDVQSSTHISPQLSSDANANVDTDTSSFDPNGAVAKKVPDIDPSAEQFENALQEAIRRSLDDILPKESSIVEADENKEEKGEKSDVPKNVSDCEKQRTILENDIGDDQSPPTAVGVKGVQGDVPEIGKADEDKDEKVENNDVPKNVSECEEKRVIEIVDEKSPPAAYVEGIQGDAPQIGKADKDKEEKGENNDVPKDLSECEEKRTTSENDNQSPPAADACVKGIQGDAPKIGMSVDVTDAQPLGNDIPRSVEIDFTTESASTVLDEFQVAASMEKSMDTDSVDSEKLLSEDQESASTPGFSNSSFVAVDCKTPVSESKSTKISKDDSFSLDAVGNGDVAEVMGKTFDMVAGVITEMLSESDRSKPLSRVEDNEKTTNENERDDVEPAAVDANKKEETNENRIEELILNSNDEITEMTDESVREDLEPAATDRDENEATNENRIGELILNSNDESTEMSNENEREDLEPAAVDGNKKEATNENGIGELILNSNDESTEMTNESEREDLEPAAVDGNKKEASNEDGIGELILNSNDESTTKSAIQEEDDDWSFVKSIESGGTSESEQMAKAAEMLGSALFNSDMKSSSVENGSDLMGSDGSFSVPSSVPTDVGTQHSRMTEFRK